MLVFVVPETGEQVEQGFKIFTVKRNQKVQIEFKFYKDVYRTQVWDLSGSTKSFFAKQFLIQEDNDIYKPDASPDWDVTDADKGILRLVLNETDLKDEKSMYAEILLLTLEEWFIRKVNEKRRKN